MSYRSPIDGYLLAVVGIVLLGFTLRVWQLGQTPLWVDEAFTSWAARNFIQGQGFSDVVGPSSPYRRAWATTTLPIAAMFSGLGLTEFAARLPSALIGTVTIVVVYLLGAQYHRQVGLVVAILVALDPFMLIWAREARMYAHLQLLYVLSVYLLYRWRVVHGLQLRSRYAIGLGIAVILGVNTHRAYLSFGAVFLAFMGLVWFNQNVRERKTSMSNLSEGTVPLRAALWLGSGIIVAVGFVILNGIPSVLTNPEPAQWPDRGYLFYWELFSNTYQILWVLAVAGIVYLLFGDEKDQMIAYAFIIPFVIASMTETKSARYVYHLVPLLFLAAVLPLAQLTRGLLREIDLKGGLTTQIDARRVGITLLIIFVLVFTPPTAAIAAIEPKTESPFHPGYSSFDEAGTFVDDHDDGSGLIMSTRPEVSMWYLNETDYFFRQNGIKNAEWDGSDLIHTRSGTIVVTDPSVMREAMEQDRPIWLLAGQRFHQGFTSNEMRAFVRQHFVQITDESWHNMELYYWTPYTHHVAFDTEEVLDTHAGNAFVYEDGDKHFLALGRTVDTPASFGEQGEARRGEVTLRLQIRQDRPLAIESRTFGTDGGERFVNISVSTDGEEWRVVHSNTDDEWTTNREEIPSEFADSDELYIRLEGGTTGSHNWGGLVDYVRVLSLADWEEEHVDSQ